MIESKGPSDSAGPQTRGYRLVGSVGVSRRPSFLESDTESVYTKIFFPTLVVITGEPSERKHR